MNKKEFFGIVYYSPGHEKTGYLWATDENHVLRTWESREEAERFGRSMKFGVHEIDWWVQPVHKEMVDNETK